MQKLYFLSIDWGTTNLRIRLVALPSFQILAEYRANLGVKKVFSEWSVSSQNRESFFLNALAEELAKWKVLLPMDATIVISGMASSSIGLRELPYSTLPFAANGQALYVEKCQTSLMSQPIFLISGVKSDVDVMRGEETFLVGLYRGFHLPDASLIILPGTHSKHVYFEKNQFVSFKTFMTGEIFDLLVTSSILKDSVSSSPLDGSEKRAFQQGVEKSQLTEDWLHILFQVRTNALFEKYNKSENFYFLSGLLIGFELKSVKEKKVNKIYICASGILYALYFEAMNTLHLTEKAVFLQEAEVDKALLYGQWEIIQQKVHEGQIQ